MKTSGRFLAILALAALLLVLVLIPAQVFAADPVISTQLTDYEPGDTVNFTG